MTTPRKIVIFGNGEIASLARYYFENDSPHTICAFAVDDEYATGDTFGGLPLVGFSAALERFPANQYAMFVAISYSKLNVNRQAKFEMVKAAGYDMPSYVCTKSVTWPDLNVGDNCFILENQTIQPTVTIEDNVMIWSGNHLGHGCHIGAHTYLASHIVLAGHSRIGQRCFIGVNATVRDFAEVGDDSFIAMDASVTGNVEAGSVVIGASSTVYEPQSRHSRMLKSKYF